MANPARIVLMNTIRNPGYGLPVFTINRPAILEPTTPETRLRIMKSGITGSRIKNVARRIAEGIIITRTIRRATVCIRSAMRTALSVPLSAISISTHRIACI